MPEEPVNWNQAAESESVSRPGGTFDTGALFDAHAPFLLRVVERLTGSGDRAEDIVQQVFLIAHQKQATVAAQEDPRKWLYHTAVNVTRHDRRSFARRARLQRSLEHEDPRPASELPDQTAEQRERGRRVREIVAKLPMKQREVFVLFELEEAPGAEIARMLDIPENTVWSRLRLARKRFERLWLSRERAEEHVR